MKLEKLTLCVKEKRVTICRAFELFHAGRITQRKMSGRYPQSELANSLLCITKQYLHYTEICQYLSVLP